MPTTQQLRQRLVTKLTELFQLDQPDLDFGFYRIMHAKAEQVNDFIQNDLLKIVNDAFGHLEVQNTQGLLAQAKQKVIDTLGDDAFDADGNLAAHYKNSPVGKRYLEEAAKIEQSKTALSAEADIYDHLYRFFERYYDAGDFISRRYYTRETSGKAAPFAVPYNGEEVKLHWANADQYYIKTTEYFSNFTFDLRQAVEVSQIQPTNKDQLAMEFGKQPVDDIQRKVHFRIVDASEGEHGNVKASEATKRFFLIHAAKPVEFNEQGELIVNFEYRNDPEKSGQDNTWREKRNGETVDGVVRQLEGMKENATAQDYLRLLKTPAPTDKEKERPLLAKYINQYTARNTMDYFIHKDLGGFLRRELDFYIKNEVMRLDDIENADAPAVESYLAKIKVLRQIAGKLIDFLAQLEDFQKKLWLKKKFVVETNYCITLDRVPEELYPEIAANDAQREEWVRLFAIDEIEQTTISPGYSVPLTEEFLRANNKLVLDTRFFRDYFRSGLLASFDDIDLESEGLLIHSENFQGIKVLSERFKQQLACVYIDPPYNTGPTEIAYKNAYRDSSWLSLMFDRMETSLELLQLGACYAIAIDDFEMPHLCEIADQVFNQYDRNMVVVNHHPQGGMSHNISRTHEYMLMMTPKGEDILRGKAKSGEIEYRSFMLSGPGENKSRRFRPNSFYALLIDKSQNKVVGVEPPPDLNHPYPTENTDEGYERRYPISPSGEEKVWCRSYESAVLGLPKDEIVLSDGGTIKLAVDTTDKRYNLMSNWTDSRYNAGPHGTALVANILGNREAFSYPKSIHTVTDAIESMTYKFDSPVILDFFAGSATTAQAIMNLNRLDNAERRYVLVEMGDYFDIATKPRVQKSIYASDWKDGKPTTRDTGISHCFKVLRLESYEDTLNNLHFIDNPARNRVLEANATLKEDFMLHYLLDVETQGSQSLLNIDAFSDPTAYTLNVKKPGSDEVVAKTVDLLETFNYLIGLRVTHIAAPQSFTAQFKRQPDPDLPSDQQTKLVIDGRMEQIQNPPHPSRAQGAPETGEGTVVGNSWWFRKVEGWVPADAANPNNGQRHKVLIVWRKLTGDQEQDNLMLDEWFKKNRFNTNDFEFQTIYVNGSNNLPNLALEEDAWKVRLIEEEFMKRMWE